MPIVYLERRHSGNRSAKAYNQIVLLGVQDKLRTDFSKYLYLFEAVIYVVAGILLSIAASAALFESGATLWQGIATRTLAESGLLTLDKLLLVLMLVELLPTVRMSI